MKIEPQIVGHINGVPIRKFPQWVTGKDLRLSLGIEGPEDNYIAASGFLGITHYHLNDTAPHSSARVTGGSVLGLGDIGPLAGKPVMEGNAVLFKRFADVDVFDLEVNSRNPDDVIRLCLLLEPTFGGIDLEDINRHRPDYFYKKFSAQYLPIQAQESQEH